MVLLFSGINNSMGYILEYEHLEHVLLGQQPQAS